MKNEYGPVQGFLVLVFVLSIPFWLLGHLYPIQLLPGLPISSLAVLTPTLAAAIMTYRSGRLPALRHLLGRAFDVQRIGAKAWYLVVVLFNPIVAVLVFGVMRATGRPVPPPPPLTIAVLPLFASFFVAALAEEIGWTGYATEPLQRRWGTLGAGLLLGLVWVVFHLVQLSQVARSF
ncbi:MAG: CPBP family intramembrane metalloprotease, partial [Anaerolineae bacterium]|nr:CPBP family intramembrane metalloprotease [Anaerolineae bacterium]